VPKVWPTERLHTAPQVYGEHIERRCASHPQIEKANAREERSIPSSTAEYLAALRNLKEGVRKWQKYNTYSSFIFYMCKKLVDLGRGCNACCEGSESTQRSTAEALVVLVLVDGQEAEDTDDDRIQGLDAVVVARQV
jgi:hypothetical protein